MAKDWQYIVDSTLRQLDYRLKNLEHEMRIAIGDAQRLQCAANQKAALEGIQQYIKDQVHGQPTREQNNG